MKASVHLFSEKTKFCYTFIILLLLLVACAPAEAEPEATATRQPATSTPTSTPSPTEVPPTPSPTVSLPVRPGRPVPQTNTPITSETVTRIQEFAGYQSVPSYRGDATYFDFLNNETLVFSMMDDWTLDRYICELPLASGVLTCESYGSDFVPGVATTLQRLVEEREVLGADGRFYRVELDGEIISIIDSETAEIFDTITFRQYIFKALSINPSSQVFLYSLSLSMSATRIILRDVGNDRNIALWEGEIHVSEFVTSQDGRFLALCKDNSTRTSSTYANIDELLVYDLNNKALVRSLGFNCNGVSMAFSPDGEHLAVERFCGELGVCTMIIATGSSERWRLEIDSIDRAITYSPDGSLLVLSCGEYKLCFVDPEAGDILHEINAPERTSNVVFSGDGRFLAALSNHGVLKLWAIADGK